MLNLPFLLSILLAVLVLGFLEGYAAFFGILLAVVMAAGGFFRNRRVLRGEVEVGGGRMFEEGNLKGQG